jgi:hypothetical protein
LVGCLRQATPKFFAATAGKLSSAKSWHHWQIDHVHDVLQNGHDDCFVNVESLFSSFSSEASFSMQAIRTIYERSWN